MPSNRIIYQNWIVELGRDPDQPRDISRDEQDFDLVSLDDLIGHPSDESEPSATTEEQKRREIIRQNVAEALGKLTEDEREFIERFYFIGQTYREISEKSGRAVHKLEAIHRRAVRKLKKHLWQTVESFFNLKRSQVNDCAICRSIYRKKIDDLIRSKDKCATWKEVMKQIRDKYGLSIATPQALIGHQKYH